MLSTTIGELMTKLEGETPITDFIAMRNKYLAAITTKLIESFPDSSEALRYYTGNELFFVFDKDKIGTLINRLGKEDGIIVLYPGVRADDNGKGRPTLIACPYKKVKDNFEFVPSTDGNSDVAEHSGLTSNKIPSGKFTIPITISEIDINTKFQISLE